MRRQVGIAVGGRSGGAFKAAAAVAAAMVALSHAAPCSADDATSAEAPGVKAASAQGASAETHYELGVKAAAADKWEEAYGHFSEAWKLKQHPQIAANLGRAALKTGRAREAAEMLTYFLEEAKDISREDQAMGEQLLSEARKQVASLRVTVSRAEVELFVDGAPAAKGWRTGDIFVEPGRRVVEARAKGVPPARVEMDVEPGSAQRVALGVSEAPAPASRPVPERPVERGGSQPWLRDPIVMAGLSGTVVATGAGVGLAIASLSKAPAPVEAGTAPADPEQYARDEEARVSLANASFWSFIAAGALGAGTLGYVLLAPRGSGDEGVRLDAVGTGVVVRGSW